MKIDNLTTEVYGFRASMRGMRNPKDSWDKSDSHFYQVDPTYSSDKDYNEEGFVLGEADKKLSQSLTKGGMEHCKHLRFVQVWTDITLPRYLWQEFDTYRHVEKVSCSTVHKLMSYDLNETMFEGGLGKVFLNEIQQSIDKYKKCDDPVYKKIYKLTAKRLLPESFLQKRTINTNYQTLLTMYNQRKNHELPEWHVICDWILSLPYFKELTGIES